MIKYAHVCGVLVMVVKVSKDVTLTWYDNWSMKATMWEEADVFLISQALAHE
jgi:hypothetical protein